MRRPDIDRPLRRGLATAALCAGLTLATGCGGAEDSKDDTPDVAAAEMKREITETVEAMADYRARQTRRLADAARQALERFEQEADEARRGLNTLEGDSRSALAKAVDRAQEASQKVETKLPELRKASQETYDEARKRLDAALAELAEARHEVAQALRGEEPS